MEILFCDDCEQRISPADLESGAAVSEGDNTYCPSCSKKRGLSAGGAGSATAMQRSGTRTRPGGMQRRESHREGRRETARSAPRGGGGIVRVVVAAAIGFVVVAGAALMVLSPKGPPPRRERRRAPEAPAQAPAAEPKPEAPDEGPRSLFGALRPGQGMEGKTPKELHDQQQRTAPPPPPPPEEPESYGPEPAPPGYSIPADRAYLQDFEGGRGGWSPVEIVDGGLGSSKKAARNIDGKRPEHWGARFRVGERTVVRVAVYVPGEGSVSMQVMAYDAQAKDNWRVVRSNLERGRWLVLRIEAGDWFRWADRSQKAVGHDMKSLTLYIEGNGTFVFDDFVVYDE